MRLHAFKYAFSQNIVLQYNDLKSGKNLTELIEVAYGPKGHGILFVEGIPDYTDIRKNTLPLFSKIPQLPEKTL